MYSAAFLVLASLLAADPVPKSEPPKTEKAAPSLGTFKLRSLGPAVTSGRIVGFAVHPKDRGHYYVAVACGGVWKTTNNGTTWTPIFDGEGSYSIGYVALDPKNPNIVWVGTGENNSQRSVGYGDGVYKSIDAGKTWQNVGLKNSEHIGKILIDPRDSNTVYVAAQGPLWNAGGDRGLYKTTDGGKTWNAVLTISENTGVTDFVMDPRNPDVLIAASYQRRRHVWTLINGGPESALHRSTDGGKTWTKIKGGIPDGELGRIGLAMAPTDPDTIYATIEASEKKGGIFRTTDRGTTWEKRNDFDRGAMYYAHLVVDPENKDRLFIMNVFVMVSDDGGKTIRRLGERWKHVDSHCMFVDPKNTDFYRVGCDGGIYESHDKGATWEFKSNLPVTQFYDIAVDETGPFYNVYGGTQDNFTLGGPARTRSTHGIMNQDWFVVQGGDGFHCRVDPKDPNTVYAESQYGGLARFDRKSGQQIGIQPQPGKGEPPLRWNWDSPLAISPHLNTRIYYAANKLFRSDDRGDTWKAVSPDLTRQIDRDRLPVMGKMWGPDAVAKHQSTSLYGNCVALSESPKAEGLIYVGTDDGLIQITQNGGGKWTKLEKFPGIPDKTYVSRLAASQHDADTVYATFDNHKMGDYAPYILKSTDRGATWTPIAGDLPARGSVLAFAEDHVNPNLLFAGTEFGVFVTLDGGKKWIRLKGGFPTISVHDLAIQKQMNDLVVGTFGRGFYVLDDYSALRAATPATLEKPVHIFKPRAAVLYTPTEQFGGSGKGFLGETLYTAENPPYGATITFHLKESFKTLKQKRLDAEKKAKGDSFPSLEDLRKEENEEPPTLIATIWDAEGNPIRKIGAPAAAGFHRITWDLRESFANGSGDEFSSGDGTLVLPGTYKVSLAARVGGVTTDLNVSETVTVVADTVSTLTLAERKELLEFQRDAAKLNKAVIGTTNTATDLGTKLDQMKKAIDQTPKAKLETREMVRKAIEQNKLILRELRGDDFLRGRNENAPVSIAERVGTVFETQRYSFSKPTNTQRENYRIAGEELADVLAKLKKLLDNDVKAIEKELEAIGAPWTPGRLPDWRDKK